MKDGMYFHCWGEVKFVSDTTYWLDNFEKAELFVVKFAIGSLGGDVFA